MKKVITFTALVLSTLFVMSFQNDRATGSYVPLTARDTTPAKDTVKPEVIYIFERTDTIKVDIVLYRGSNGIVRYAKPGYYIRKGQAKLSPDKKSFLWIVEPAVIGGLDEFRKPINVILF